jgi:hypothetical protein
MFDKVFESIEQKLKPAGDAINKTLDKGLKSSKDDTLAIGAGAAGATGLTGAGGLALLAGSGYLGTGAAATAATIAAGGIAIGSGLVLGTAAAYLAIPPKFKGEYPGREEDTDDIQNDLPYGNPMSRRRLGQQQGGWRDPVWTPPKEWPTSSAPIQNVTKDGALSAGAPPLQAVEVTGTVTGEAAINLTVTVNPSPLLTSIVDQAKNYGNMSVRGKLGTGLSGDGNATKESQPARTTPSGGSH